MKENILYHKKDILPLNEIFREIIFSEADNKNFKMPNYSHFYSLSNGTTMNLE